MEEVKEKEAKEVEEVRKNKYNKSNYLIYLLMEKEECDYCIYDEQSSSYLTSLVAIDDNGGGGGLGPDGPDFGPPSDEDPGDGPIWVSDNDNGDDNGSDDEDCDLMCQLRKVVDKGGDDMAEDIGEIINEHANDNNPIEGPGGEGGPEGVEIDDPCDNEKGWNKVNCAVNKYMHGGENCDEAANLIKVITKAAEAEGIDKKKKEKLAKGNEYSDEFGVSNYIKEGLLYLAYAGLVVSFGIAGGFLFYDAYTHSKEVRKIMKKTKKVDASTFRHFENPSSQNPSSQTPIPEDESPSSVLDDPELGLSPAGKIKT